MIWLPEDLSRYPRPDLISWVAATCIQLPHTPPQAQLDWCEQHFGEQRAGNILQEAKEGRTDYFDGDWQLTYNPFRWGEKLVLWFANRDDQVAFQVAWS